MLQPGPQALEKLAATTREGRMAALLDEAAREFNARGVAGASLTRIAKAVGLTRAALYYYVRDRADLAQQAYLRACEQMAADLAAAAGGPDGLSRILAWIHISLAADRKPLAVLSEIDALPEPGRAAVVAAHQTNVERLRAIIRDGVADSSIRPCDDEVIAQTLIGAVAWAPISEAWVGGDHTAFRARRAETLADVIADGMAVDPATTFMPPPPIDCYFATPPNAFDREGAIRAKLEQLLLTASQLFNRRGVTGVSLDEIAAELGATKGAVYHYLQNKTELVVRCYQRAFDLYERFVETAATGRDPLQCSLIGLWLNVQAHTSGLSPMNQLAGIDGLPARTRQNLQRRGLALRNRFETWGQDGVVQGLNRPLDMAITAEIGAGFFEWMPKWFDPRDPRAAHLVADEIVRLFIGGLRQR